MRCYFDGSESGDKQWLTLGGVAAPDDFWSNFQAKWQEMLANRTPVAKHIHMCDIATGNKLFSNKHGWNNDKRHKLVMDALMLLANEMPKSRYRSFRCSIDTFAHKRLTAAVNLGSKADCPHKICADWSIGHTVNWFIDEHELEKVYIFFDQNERFMHSFHREWLSHRQPKNGIHTNLFFGLIANVQPADMRLTPPLQVADMVAWAATRNIVGIPRPYLEMKTLMRIAIPTTDWEFGEEMLRDLLVEKHGISEEDEARRGIR